MFCKYCGNKLPDGAKFCDSCGEAFFETNITAGTDKNGRPTIIIAPGNTPRNAEGSGNITMCKDGKYRWVYELHLLKNPHIYFLVWKIFFFIILGIFAFMMILDMFEQEDFFPDGFLSLLKILGIGIAGMTVLVAVSSIIHAAVSGWKYCVMFEMDEKGVNHKQMPKQAQRSELIAAITVLAGLAGGNITAAGSGLAAARTEMHTDFSVVRKVRAYPRKNLIKVNGLLEHNQVYVQDEDFDFVKDYIISHCTNLK